MNGRPEKITPATVDGGIHLQRNSVHGNEQSPSDAPDDDDE